MSSVDELVIQRFWNVYGEPFTPDPEALMAEYERSLSGYSDDVLSKAVDRAIDEFDRPSGWPRPGVVNGFCKVLLPARPVTTQGWDDGRFVPKDAASRARVRAMAEECKAAMAAASLKTMPKPSSQDYQHMDVSRPVMERNERRWRRLERGLTDQSKRMMGDTE